MKKEDQKTLDKILKVSKQKFLAHGFKDASLRNIVKEAGLTTGAFYGYFKNKEELFNVLVKDTADKYLTMYANMAEEFERLSFKVKRELMIQDYNDYLDTTIDYIYDHFDEYKLLSICSEGTMYEDFIDNIIDLEVKIIMTIFDEAKVDQAKMIDENAVHIIMTAYFNGILEVVRHDMDRSAADNYLSVLARFYRAGWKSIFLGVSEDNISD